jgi:CheY-like chemotaxis protein
MKILVIDDSPIHQAAAKKQLGEHHDLTVVGSYDEGQALLGYEKWDRHSDKHDFEVVLVDLLMPPSRQMQSDSRAWEEMPVGIFLAILAAKNGAKYVAVLTDSNHHSHPASACIDALNKKEYRPSHFVVEGAQVLLSNNRGWVHDDESVPPQEVERERLDGTKYLDKVYPRIKRWDLLFKYLLKLDHHGEVGGIA